MPSQPSDDELVRRSLAGEPRAFAQLVERHQRLVFGVALSGARDVAHAEDLAQEAFVEAWRDLPRLRDRARVGSWIAGIARNLARRWARHTARRRQREAIATRTAPEVVATPLDTALDRETRSLVRGALAELPEAYREALVLYYMHGRSSAEVATRLGISEDLVKQRLSRGRRALRSSLELHVEGALEQLGPSKGFAAMVMIAVGAATARSAAAAGAAGKVWSAMKVNKLALVGVAIFVAGGIAWYYRAPGASDPRRAADKATPTGATSPRDPPEHTGTPTVRRVASREAREQLLQSIRNAYRRRIAMTPPRATTTPAAPAAPPAPAAPAEVPSTRSASAADDDTSSDSDNDYIRSAMSGLLPMIVECYKQARETHPMLAGTLVVNFTIEGEPGVGGLVMESAIDPEHSQIQDPGLDQCVQETMFALEIDAPTHGGIVKVTFPFTFRPNH
ncbi:MAG: sigma-70 family RNA polymerase sigma factor [Kofleriaceae bacterium]